MRLQIFILKVARLFGLATFIVFLNFCRLPASSQLLETSALVKQSLVEEERLPPLSQKEFSKIADKVFINETGRNTENLLFWSENEDFPSLGYFHFIWFCKNTQSTYREIFPDFVKFAASKGKEQDFLKKYVNSDTGHCPWNSRSHFYQFQKSDPNTWDEIEKFLKDTHKEQQEFGLLNRFNQFLKDLKINQTPDQVDALLQIMAAIAKENYYPLLDYVNFKGEGFTNEIRDLNFKFGLLQVLTEATNVDTNFTPTQAFSIGAAKVLATRVTLQPSHEWALKSWLRRACSYSNIAKVPSINGTEFICD